MLPKMVSRLEARLPAAAGEGVQQRQVAALAVMTRTRLSGSPKPAV